MSVAADRVRLVFQVAFRNLWLDRLRTGIIAVLLGAGAFLAVLGLSLLRDIESSMRASVTESVTGDLQLYSSKAKDELAIFGGGFMGRAEVGVLPDIVPVRETVLAHPNVAAFIPMGLDMAILGRGNELDDTLDALRAALKEKDQTIVKNRVDQLRFQFDQLGRELAEKRKLEADQAQSDREQADLNTAAAPGYLDGLTLADETKLQFLETRIAPLSGEKQPIYLRYLGTDIDLFRANFPKFKVVEGDVLPPGQRGIMLSHKIREEFLKNLVARLFDRLHKALTKRGAKIAGDPENERLAADLKRQYPQVLSYLDRADAESLTAKLAARGIPGEGDGLVPKLTSQLVAFLTVDDANFAERFDWFYANVAPKIRLYEFYPGQSLILRNYTRSGYIKSVSLKIYGVYGFDGLEDSDVAGAMNIIDLVSFRELYGQMTEASQKELDEMRHQVGLKDVAADNAEAALFGDSAPKATQTIAATAAAAAETLHVKPTIPDKFAPDEIRRGLALNAAVKLKDEKILVQTQKELGDTFKAKGLEVQVIDWQKASGIVGQFVNIVGLALVFALLVILLVAFVIINNSIIVGTLNRTREIGTMRAIGAQRSFVVFLFLAETGITGLIGALGGAFLAIMLLVVAGKQGIPAGNDVLTFLFSGPRLYPTLSWKLVLASPLAITLAATLTSVYAARHAARIRPAEATQEKE